jgi:hypothetical protein
MKLLEAKRNRITGAIPDLARLYDAENWNMNDLSNALYSMLLKHKKNKKSISLKIVNIQDPFVLLAIMKVNLWDSVDTDSPFNFEDVNFELKIDKIDSGSNSQLSMQTFTLQGLSAIIKIIDTAKCMKALDDKNIRKYIDPSGDKLLQRIG